MPRTALSLLYASSVLLPLITLAADPAPKLEPKYPFRVGWANEHLPWYQPQPLAFPPHHSDQRISGELVQADFVHRTGQFRMSKTGELMDFAMPPYGAIDYLNASADLRDVPLGTFFLYFLNQDKDGRFTRLATMQDQFTMDASHAFSYRLDEVKLSEGKLLTTKHSIPKKQDDLGKKELLVTSETRVWKGDQQVKLADLKPGDELLYNLTGKTADKPGRCTDVWIGADTHRLTAETQRKKFAEFTKVRGVPGWIDKTEGNAVTVTFFSGDSQHFKKELGAEFIVGKDVKLCVANDELRTWNPPVDGVSGSITEVQTVPTDAYGSSGVRVVLKMSAMLEGFRKGRVVRVFGPGWKTQDQFYGESLMGYGFGRMLNQELVENVAKEYPEQFPFRTDFSNAPLPWYQVKDGVKPPPFSEHLVFGELVKAGQFRTERTGDLVDFTLLDKAVIKRLGKEAKLEDLPVGQRYRFHLYQDAKGAFTRASLVSDEFSHLEANAATYRLTSLNAEQGTMNVAWQLPEVKDYNGDMKRPPDVGHSILRISSSTRVWKDQQSLPLADLKLGAVLRINVTGELPGQPSRCSDLWLIEPLPSKP